MPYGTSDEIAEYRKENEDLKKQLEELWVYTVLKKLSFFNSAALEKKGNEWSLSVTHDDFSMSAKGKSLEELLEKLGKIGKVIELKTSLKEAESALGD